MQSKRNDIGIICDLEFFHHYLFVNCYHALNALYGRIKQVTVLSDLDGIEILFVCDDHYRVHKGIITQSGFVDKCNTIGIKFVVFTTERIFDSFFPWNVDNYNFIRQFNQLYHYNLDVNDCTLLGTKLYRSFFSKYFKNLIKVDVDNKLDKVVFIGSTILSCYQKRREDLRKLNENIPNLEIIPPTIKSRKEYLETLAKYRFVLSPIGNNNSLTLRFYEALLVKSIPVYQVNKNTLLYYDIEAKFDDCIFFQDVDEIPEKIQNCTLKHSHTEFWLEDYLGKLLREDNLL